WRGAGRRPAGGPGDWRRGGGRAPGGVGRPRGPSPRDGREGTQDGIPVSEIARRSASRASVGLASMRVLVVSDVHSNLPALDAVLQAAGSVDAVWHLGDIVGYGPDPDAVVARLAEVSAIGVRGNHDAAAVGGREIEMFNTDARRAMEW